MIIRVSFGLANRTKLYSPALWNGNVPSAVLDQAAKPALQKDEQQFIGLTEREPHQVDLSSLVRPASRVVDTANRGEGEGAKIITHFPSRQMCMFTKIIIKTLLFLTNLIIGIIISYYH